jgi:hypothetical protein
MFVVYLNQLRRFKQWLKAPLCGREFLIARGQQVVFPHAGSPLAVFEGLFVASMFSTLFWSILAFALLHRP